MKRRWSFIPAILVSLVAGTGCAPAPDPIPLVLPADNLAPYDGKLVTLAQPMWVADSYNLERYGTLLLYAGAAPRVYTSENRPDADGFARHQADFAARSLLLDDDSLEQNVWPVAYLEPTFVDGVSRPVRLGDRVIKLTGILEYSPDSSASRRSSWRLRPTKPVEFAAGSPRPGPVSRSTGALRIAGINTLNAFFTLDRPGATCGPNKLGCRGANSAEERRRQFDKLATALAAIDADVYALMEVENDDGRSLEQIAAQLSATSGGNFLPIKTGAIGTDAIRVALVYKSATVRPVGNFAVLDAGVDPEFIDNRNRPVLAQSFATRDTGEVFTVAVNHLKSKGSDCDDLGDPDRQDGQGNCNLTRLGAARAEIRWLASDPTGSGDPDVLVLGDLNAYRYEDPVRAFVAAGYNDLVEQHAGDGSYSYGFRGQAGALDHALATPALASQVRSARPWNVNADEARVLDYNLDYGRNPNVFSADQVYRFSDHDPIIVDFVPGTPASTAGESP